MAETTMEPWSFTIVFDEDKAKKNGYEVDTLYDYVGKNVEGLRKSQLFYLRFPAQFDMSLIPSPCISPVFHHLGWR